MEPAALCHFIGSNVVLPNGNQFFVPEGGLLCFLSENLHFKVFLLIMSVFTNAYCTDSVPSLTTSELWDLIRHMFFSAQIRQNEYCISYNPVAMPSKAAWMFHVTLCLLHILGFDGDKLVTVRSEHLLCAGHRGSENFVARLLAEFKKN
ncbi:hypothetical protein C8J57DRAFT_1224146 [Mycena rebaudengoi]|nr:hypothetical protein C8J57DRAFT_1224146 [Mycena rebaudengoi]